MEANTSGCTCPEDRSEKCSLLTQRIKASMFAEWYPKLSPLKCTYKSKVIPLSSSFVEGYLKQDGMHMPEV